MPRHAKLTKVTRNKGFIAGLRARLPPDDTLVLRGVKHTVAEVIALLEKHVAMIDETGRREAAWHAAVVAEAAMEERIARLCYHLGLFVRHQLAADPSDLQAFGIKSKARKITVATRAAAAEKALATRAARGTMGKRQRAKIKG